MHVARSWLLPVGAAGLVNVALGVAVLVAVAAGTAALVVPVEPASSYTGFSVLTQQSDGSYVANGYPTTVDVGEEIELVAGIENHEVGPVSYTVVVELQRVSIQDGTARAAYVSELTRFETTVEAGETRYVTHRVRPTLRGENLRLVYYLYEGEVPADPSAENAYRSLQLWIDVGVPDDTDAGSTESA